MKKFMLSFSVIFLFVFYALFGKKTQQGAATVGVIQNLITATPSQSQSQNKNSSTGTYKDGQYTGSVADAYYGNIQVKVIILSGKITDVQFLQSPGDRRTSIEINSQAMPMLRQEAISAQNATVDIVSGATDSSQAFIQSLGSALSQAI